MPGGDLSRLVTFPPSAASVAAAQAQAAAAQTTAALALAASASPLVFVQTADRTISNTATETSTFAAGVGSRTIPANRLVAGSVIRITGSGVFATPATGANVTTRVKLGSSTVVSATSGNLVLSGDGTSPVTLDIALVVRSAGASGSLMCAGEMIFSVGAATAVTGLSLASPVAVDTTQALAVDFTSQWDSANTNRSVTIKTAFVEVRN